MFYTNQSEEEKQNYKHMLTVLGNLSMLFSESDSPYLHYRVHENMFCKYFNADNLARLDCSADAKKERLGIGLKTWVGRDDQKVAEFGKLRDEYKFLEGIELVKRIAHYRNERIRITKNLNGIDEMIYHIVKRVPGKMLLLESAFEMIQIENIKILPSRGNENNTYFTDGKHTYHFSTSKNTLYMIFEDYQIVDEFDVPIMDDPFNFLKSMSDNFAVSNGSAHYLKLRLNLYSYNKREGRFVPPKSGLNQWNAGGRDRHADEIYIPFPKSIRSVNEDFFPPRDVSFNLILPDGKKIVAKRCQDEGKAIMSNPNRDLGKWLLRDVLELPERILITYDMLEEYGINAVEFTKLKDDEYKIAFTYHPAENEISPDGDNE